MTNWKQITSVEDVESIFKRSNTRPQIIFKDSVSCGISAFAKERLREGNQSFADADFNYLDLLSLRSVSNYIAERLNVIHQSPQIIVLKSEKVVYTVTHHSIDAQKIKQYIK